MPQLHVDGRFKRLINYVTGITGRSPASMQATRAGGSMSGNAFGDLARAVSHKSFRPDPFKDSEPPKPVEFINPLAGNPFKDLRAKGSTSDVGSSGPAVPAPAPLGAALGKRKEVPPEPPQPAQPVPASDGGRANKKAKAAPGPAADVVDLCDSD